ncbi:hypothetical protein Tco_0552790 [Tanacetum coccineum]
MEQMLLAKHDEAGDILTDEQNDFLFADASRMEEIEELSANICLMSRIQPTNIDYDAGPSYNSAFLSEVQTPSTSYVNPPLKITKSKNLEQQRDKLDLNIVELKRKTMELQKTQSILKRKMSENEDQYHDTVLNLEAKVKRNVDTIDTEDILEDATKSQIKMKNKMKDPIVIEKKQNVSTIDSNKLNALYEDFVPQKELSAEQKYFPPSFISPEDPINESSTYSSSVTQPTKKQMSSANPILVDLNEMEIGFQTLFKLLQTKYKQESIFYTSLEEIRLNDFCQRELKPILQDLHFKLEIFQKRFLRDIKEMKDVFKATESDLCETWKQNEHLKDQLLEANLKHEIECCMMLSHECVDNNMKDEIEKVQRDSIEIQEGMQK